MGGRGLFYLTINYLYLYLNVFITSLVLEIGFNVLALGAVADFGAQNCQYTTKVDAR